jgi:hypothetical protein
MISDNYHLEEERVISHHRNLFTKIILSLSHLSLSVLARSVPALFILARSKKPGTYYVMAVML